MVSLNLAYTAPINPAGASPNLTEAQIWAGLHRKVRRAQEFVPVISACKVISDDGDTVVREATFVEGTGLKSGPNAPVREVCIHHPPSRIDFQQEDGSTISNIVSKGPDGELLMTYSFEWRHPELAAGSEEAETLRKQHEQMAKMAVEGSINTIRRLVNEKEIA